MTDFHSSENTPSATGEAAPSKALHPPKLDLQRMLETLKVPPVDARALIEGRRKDIEALLAANERAFVGLEALTRKQTDLLYDIMKEWQAGAKDVVSPGGPADKVSQVSQHAQHAFAHALANMKNMADIVTKSQEDVLSILNHRYHEGVEELRSLFRK